MSSSLHKTVPALLSSLLLATSLQASTALNDWYHINARTTTHIVGGNTSSSTILDLNNQSLSTVFSYFNPVNLNDGQKLKLEFSLSFDLAGAGASKSFNLFRFGLFNTRLNDHATTTIFGEDRVADSATGNSYTLGWNGFLLTNPSTPITANPLPFYRKTGAAGVNFASTSDISATQYLTTTGSYTMDFADEVARTFTLELTRNGTNLLISGSYGGGTFSGTAANFITTADDSRFDGFAFTTGAADGVIINSASFSNATITVIPEATTAQMLLITALAAGAFTRLRRRTA